MTIAALRTLLSVAALCAPASADSIPHPDTYVYLTIGDASSLDPAWNGDHASADIWLNLYDTLFAFEGASTDKVKAWVASTVPTRTNGLLSADGLRYRIPIRKGIRFHDGTPLTPEDVRYSMMRFMIMDAGPAMMLLDPLTPYHSTRDANGRLSLGVYDVVAKAVQVEGDSVVLHLPKPYPPLLTILARWCPIVSKSWAVAHGDWAGDRHDWQQFNFPKKEQSPFFVQENGSGAFRLVRWDRHTSEIVLERVDDYWAGPAKIRSAVIKAVPSLATRELMLKAGDADSIESNITELGRIRGARGVEVFDDLPSFDVSPDLEFCFAIHPKANRFIGSGRLDGEGIPPGFFADRDVRRGFAYAFNYDALINDVFHGKGTRANGFIPPGMFGRPREPSPYSFDPARAKSNLQRAYNGRLWEKGFRFTVVYNLGNDVRHSVAVILKQGLESINPKFRVDVQGLDWPSYLDAEDRALSPMLSSGRYAPYSDPQALAFQFLESDPLSPCHYRSKEADRRVERALRETDAARRAELYHQLVAFEHREVPFLPLADIPHVRVQRDWIQGWTYNPMLPSGSLLRDLEKRK